MSVETDRELALKTLREICEKSDAPAQAKSSAARTILEMLGDIGRLQETKKDLQNKALSEMTKNELDAEIARIAKAPDTIPISERRPKSSASKRAASKRKASSKSRKASRTNGALGAKYDF